MDLSLNVYRVPNAGETVSDNGGVAYIPGGKGANAAVTFSKLGAHTVFCTKLGADLHGQQLFKYYKELGLDTTYVTVDRDYPTGFAAVIKESDGQNRIIHYPGANLHITNDNVADAVSSNPDAIFLGFEISFDTVLAAARMAASRGIPIFIDAAPANKAHALELLPEVEIFSPNEAETLEYTGIMPIGTDASLRAALALWRKVKCRYVVIKQGARGACIYDGKHFEMVSAERVEKVVDTTAAGDAFTAAMTLEYLRTGDIKSAVKYGTVAGAITVSRAGASSSVPSAEEIRSFLLANR